MAVRGAFRSQLGGILFAVAVLALIYGGFAGCEIMASRHEEQHDDGLAGWLAELETLNPELMPHARDTTAQTCTEDLPCRWAVSSDTAVVMMFSDNPAACQAADALPATYWQDRVAVRFTPGALTQDQQDDLLIHIDTYYKRFWDTDRQATPDPWALHEDNPCPSA